MQLGSHVAPVLGNAVAASRVHVVGLAGSGIRGIVRFLLARGARVSGSDQDDGPVMARFRRDGVQCWVGHSDANVAPETDLVLISAAVTPDNPEVRVAEKRRIHVLKYAQCLGYLMSEKQGIAVAGTHGKTTTSAMVSFVLINAGLDPSFVIGGEHPDLGGGSRSGQGRHFVAEACEFDRSFLNLRPRAAAITNIEAEHLDYFDSLGDIQGAFREFVGLLPEDGYLVYNRDDANSRFLAEYARGTTEGFSLRPGGGDWWVEDVLLLGERSSFDLRGPGGVRAHVRLRVPGVHNVRNALASAAICAWAGVPLEKIVEGLGQFRGVRRRFEILARGPVTVIDDYAHHPTEVGAVLRTARQAFPERPLLCVFQPHQYSRLRIMMEEFADALQVSDHVFVTQVYRSRDSDHDVRSVSAGALSEAIRSRGASCSYAGSFSELRQNLDRLAQPGSVVLFLGAGSITELAATYADAVTSRNGNGHTNGTRVPDHVLRRSAPRARWTA